MEGIVEHQTTSKGHSFYVETGKRGSPSSYDPTAATYCSSRVVWVMWQGTGN
ncbi:hypothetical protein LINPERHAP2_LOCUS41380 [Linum perenne]